MLFWRCTFTQTVWLVWNVSSVLLKDTLAANTTTLDQVHDVVCMRLCVCVCVNSLTTWPSCRSKIKQLCQTVWQCERLVARFEVAGLITLQRDWFRFSRGGCLGAADGWRSQRKRSEKNGQSGHGGKKRWRSFNLDLNRTLLLQMFLLLSLLWHQQVGANLFLFQLWPILFLFAF